jgi:gamma-glutamyltranspeptidase
VAVAAPHHLASDAGAGAVRRGGCAIDAAIAATLTLTVAYPHQCSLGGDLIAMVRLPSGTTRAVVSVGAAARDADVEAIRSAHTRMPGRGPLTITVPGLLGGLLAVAGLGARLPVPGAFERAAEHASHGVRVSPGLARALAGNAAVLAADPGASAVLLRPDGTPPAEGEVLRQPALGRTLRRLALAPGDLYSGELAAALAGGLRRLGSPLTEADLAAHRAEVLAPVQRRRAGVLWSVPPPPSQAVGLLAVLGDTPHPPSGLLLDRSVRVAAVRDAELADPACADVPLAGFFAAADGAAGSVSAMGRAAHRDPRANGDTVAVTAVDSDGLAVSIVASVYQSFGSGLLDPATGIVLHNRGSAFSLDPRHPGRLRPGARPPHTLSPVVAVREADQPVVAALGCQGGRAQPWILAQVADDLMRDGADLAAVLGRPRWVFGTRDIGADEPTLVIEASTVPEPLVAVAAGHGLRTQALGRDWDEAGHVQLARLDRHGLAGAADPRADGTAVVASPSPDRSTH